MNKLRTILLLLLCGHGLNAQMHLRHLMESTCASNFLDINQDEIPDLVMTNAQSFSIAIGNYDSTGHLQFTMIPLA